VHSKELYPTEDNTQELGAPNRHRLKKENKEIEPATTKVAVISRRQSQEKRDESPRCEGWAPDRSKENTDCSLNVLELESSFPLISIDQNNMSKLEEKYTNNQEVEMLEFSPTIDFDASFSSSDLLESTLSMQHTFAQWENDQSYEQDGQADLPLSPLLPQPALLHEPFRKRHYSEDNTTFNRSPAIEDNFRPFSQSCPSPDKFFSLWSHRPNSNHCLKTEPSKRESPHRHISLLRRNSAPAKVIGNFGKDQATQPPKSASLQPFTAMPPPTILALLSTTGVSKKVTSSLLSTTGEIKEVPSNIPDSKSETDEFFCQLDEVEEQGSDFRNAFAVSDNMPFLDDSFFCDDLGHFERNSVKNVRDEPPKVCQQQRSCREANIPAVHMNQFAKKINHKRFVCELCGKHFTQKGGLLNHIRIHTGERPFQCQECGKCFTQKCNLTRHHRIHTGEKPYECHLCYRRFNRKWGLVVHLRAHQNATISK